MYRQLKRNGVKVVFDGKTGCVTGLHIRRGGSLKNALVATHLLLNFKEIRRK